MSTETTDESPLNLEPLEDFEAYVPLRVAVLTRVKQAILDGVLKPGELLSENRIANQLSVSRTPVREALRVLEQENLVTMLPGRKVIVSVPSPEDIDEIYDIRFIVESEALRRITPDRTDLIERLEACVARQEAALERRDLRALRSINTEFHMLFVSVLNNRRLRQFIDSVYDSITRFRLYSLENPEWMEHGSQEHRRLVELIKSGDTEGAVQMLRQHLDAARNIVTKMFN
jgi:DNA-binding GntR family transcriptional regulator